MVEMLCNSSVKSDERVRSDRLQPVKGPAEAGHYEHREQRTPFCGTAEFALVVD